MIKFFNWDELMKFYWYKKNLLKEEVKFISLENYIQDNYYGIILYYGPRLFLMGLP